MSLASKQQDHGLLFFTSLQSEPTQLLPNLYIGDQNHSMDEKILHNLGITAILNVSVSIKHDVSSSFTYKVLPIQDTVTENIAAWFGEAFSFIGKFVK